MVMLLPIPSYRNWPRREVASRVGGLALWGAGYVCILFGVLAVLVANQPLGLLLAILGVGLAVMGWRIGKKAEVAAKAAGAPWPPDAPAAP